MDSEKNNKKSRLNMYTVWMLICVIIFLFALYKVVSIFMEYKKINDFYDGLRADMFQDNDFMTAAALRRLIEINDDVKGWIYIKDTNVNYPILQGTNNQYYLYRTYDKQYLGAGSIFLNSTSNPNFTDSHTIVFGHNMRNGSMFGSLDKFSDESYRDEHPYVYVLLPDGKWNKYRIFATYIADVDDGTFDISVDYDDGYYRYLQLCQSKNYYQNAAAPEEGKPILTLSTCTNDSDDVKRYVIQAVYVEALDTLANE